MVKAVQVPVTKFQGNDGKLYDTEVEALRADERFREKEDPIFHFGRTYFGRTMLAKTPLNTYATWRVEGEDPNCDFGGHHHNPFLGYFEGTLAEVIKKAYTLPGWTTWGGGGQITKVEPRQVTKLNGERFPSHRDL